MSSIVGRRFFLKTSAAAGSSLLLAFHLPAHERPRTSVPSSGTSFAPNAFLELCPDGQIRIWCARSEIGQGVRTSLPMIVADELGCDWARITVVQGDLDARFGDQTTGGSYSVRGSYADLRKAGAAARAMLLSAASTEWRVPPSECRVENSFILHSPTQRKVTFEKLLSAASSLQPPADPPLKKPSDFALIGRPTRRTDTIAKITGAAQFGIDTRISGMLVASVERCPVYGGKPRRFNADKIKSMPGVRAVLELPAVHLTHQFREVSGPGSRNFTCSGVAIVADSTWAALQARKALYVEWSETDFARESTDSLCQQLAALTAEPAAIIRNDGDFDKAHGAAATRLEAVYEVPFLAHAAMEPANCAAHVRGDYCELWAPTQIPGAAADSVAAALNISRDRVQVHVPSSAEASAVA